MELSADERPNGVYHHLGFSGRRYLPSRLHCLLLPGVSSPQGCEGRPHNRTDGALLIAAACLSAAGLLTFKGTETASSTVLLPLLLLLLLLWLLQLLPAVVRGVFGLQSESAAAAAIRGLLAALLFPVSSSSPGCSSK